MIRELCCGDRIATAEFFCCRRDVFGASGKVIFAGSYPKEDFHGKSRILQWKKLCKIDKIKMKDSTFW